MRTATKIKVGDCVLHPRFGPLYVNDRFRDGSGSVLCGINGEDGVSYQFNASEITSKLSRDQFDAMPKKAN